jgi:hypothetical protein
VGPALAGAAQQIALGAPFVIAGTLKIAYDLMLWAWFRRVPLDDGENEVSARETPAVETVASRAR